MIDLLMYELMWCSLALFARPGAVVPSYLGSVRKKKPYTLHDGHDSGQVVTDMRTPLASGKQFQ